MLGGWLVGQKQDFFPPSAKAEPSQSRHEEFVTAGQGGVEQGDVRWGLTVLFAMDEIPESQTSQSEIDQGRSQSPFLPDPFRADVRTEVAL